MVKKLQIKFQIPKEKEGEYLTLPFQMPEGVAEFRLSYQYPKYQQESLDVTGGSFTAIKRTNTIDLGLIAPDGQQVGASGSNKKDITISEESATPGYAPWPLTPGEWQILAGAYQVAPEGVTVQYNLTFVLKENRLLFGDIHTHTTGSDGVLSLEELATHAKKHKFDYLAITDHNQMVAEKALNRISEITLIPGVEWTHYAGHASFIGVPRPYDEPFFTANLAEVQARFTAARQRGALIVINHPCDESCGFQFDFNQLPFDCLEIWNGPMRESNFKAIAKWEEMLEAGKRIPAVGGSDYHRDRLFQILGGPCMGVYAQSNTAQDILAALRAGHSFITFSREGPALDLRIGEAVMGKTIPWQPDLLATIKAKDLKQGDQIRVLYGTESTDLFQAPADGEVNLSLAVPKSRFIRIEIYRTFLPGIPPLPALISNPIFFSETSEQD